jgi:hypothetical protein
MKERLYAVIIVCLFILAMYLGLQIGPPDQPPPNWFATPMSRPDRRP